MIDANESFLRLLGYRREEVVGRTSTELEIWPARLDRHRIVEDLIAYGSIRDRECSMCTKDGRILTTHYSAEFVDIDGTPCILSLLVDITHGKRGRGRPPRKRTALPRGDRSGKRLRVGIRRRRAGHLRQPARSRSARIRARGNARKVDVQLHAAGRGPAG